MYLYVCVYVKGIHNMQLHEHVWAHANTHTQPHTQLVQEQTCIHHLHTVPTYSTYMDGRMDG